MIRMRHLILLAIAMVLLLSACSTGCSSGDVFERHECERQQAYDEYFLDNWIEP